LFRDIILPLFSLRTPNPPLYGRYGVAYAAFTFFSCEFASCVLPGQTPLLTALERDMTPPPLPSDFFLNIFTTFPLQLCLTSAGVPSVDTVRRCVNTATVFQSPLAERV